MTCHDPFNRGCTENGVTLLEFLSYIALASMALAGVLAFYSISRQSAVGVDSIQTANAFVSALRAINSQQDSPDWVGSAGVLPKPAGWSDWTTAGGKTSTTKSGMTIAIRQSGANAILEFSTTEKEVCLKVAQSLVGGVAATANGCTTAPYTVLFEGISPR